jgi:hypothetical protein
LAAPRAPVRLPFGAAFLRAARLTFLRSGFANFFVFAIIPFLIFLSNFAAVYRSAGPLPIAKFKCDDFAKG